MSGSRSEVNIFHTIRSPSDHSILILASDPLSSIGWIHLFAIAANHPWTSFYIYFGRCYIAAIAEHKQNMACKGLTGSYWAVKQWRFFTLGPALPVSSDSRFQVSIAISGVVIDTRHEQYHMILQNLLCKAAESKSPNFELWTSSGVYSDTVVDKPGGSVHLTVQL